MLTKFTTDYQFKTHKHMYVKSCGTFETYMEKIIVNNKPSLKQEESSADFLLNLGPTQPQRCSDVSLEQEKAQFTVFPSNQSEQSRPYMQLLCISVLTCLGIAKGLIKSLLPVSHNYDCPRERWQTPLVTDMR